MRPLTFAEKGTSGILWEDVSPGTVSSGRAKKALSLPEYPAKGEIPSPLGPAARLPRSTNTKSPASAVVRHVFRIEGVHITYTLTNCQAKPVARQGARSVPIL